MVCPVETNAGGGDLAVNEHFLAVLKLDHGVLHGDNEHLLAEPTLDHDVLHDGNESLVFLFC